MRGNNGVKQSGNIRNHTHDIKILRSLAGITDKNITGEPQHLLINTFSTFRSNLLNAPTSTSFCNVTWHDFMDDDNKTLGMANRIGQTGQTGHFFHSL